MKKPITELDTSKLQNCRIFVDVDGTLTPDGKALFSKEIIEKIGQIGTNNEVIISSNKLHLTERNSTVAGFAHGSVLKTQFQKQDPRVLHDIPPTEKRQVVIGDKITTDGMFARLLGASFIQVARYTDNDRTLRTRLIDLYDNILSALFKNIIAPE